MLHEIVTLRKKEDGQCKEKKPYQDDKNRCNAIDRLSLIDDLLRLFATFGHDLGWDHGKRNFDPQRDQDQIVQISEDGDEVWN